MVRGSSGMVSAGAWGEFMGGGGLALSSDLKTM